MLSGGLGEAAHLAGSLAQALAAVAGEFACIFVFAAMILALATALFLRTP